MIMCVRGAKVNNNTIKALETEIMSVKGPIPAGKVKAPLIRHTESITIAPVSAHTN